MIRIIVFVFLFTRTHALKGCSRCNPSDEVDGIYHIYIEDYTRPEDACANLNGSCLETRSICIDICNRRGGQLTESGFNALFSQSQDTFISTNPWETIIPCFVGETQVYGSGDNCDAWCPRSCNANQSDTSELTIALGLGLGLGIPVLAFGLYMCYRRKTPSERVNTLINQFL